MVCPKFAANFFAYSGLFGVTCYETFFSTATAYRALPLEMFGRLQHQVFPGYFKIQAALSSALLLTVPFKGDNTLAYSVLGFNLVSTFFSLFFVLPRTHKIVAEREKQMEIEGKRYNDEGISETMKSLNASFTRLHVKSMIANFGVVIATFVYGGLFVSKLHL